MKKNISTKNVNDPRWGDANRDKKGLSILQTIISMSTLSIAETTWLDIGCGSGGIAASIAPHVKSITGLDPESWERWNSYTQSHENLDFINESVESLSYEDNSIDVVICNQVYEHVPNPVLLINEIYRILKPGGVCYFAGPNLLFPIEPHVFWPFIHWLPRNIAVNLMKLLGSKKILDAYSTNYWTLMKWLNKFEVKNALPYIIKNPNKFSNKGSFWKLVSLFPEKITSNLSFLSPGFIFLIEKND